MQARITGAGVVLALGVSLACGSSTQSVTGPSASKCTLTAIAEPTTFGPAGGAGALTVRTNRECQWNAAASGDWIQLGAPSSGQGDATVPFTVATNADPSQRRGTITIGDRQLAISQDAAPCIFTLSTLHESVSPEGERRTITVTANGPQCSWTARTEVDWVTIVQGSQGNGNGAVVYEARPTTGPSRTGEITVAGHRVTVTQGTGCSLVVAPAVHTVAAGGGSGVISVSTGADCPWSAQSDAGWISIASAASRIGPGTVTFAVGAWDGPARTGTLRVGSQVVTIRQNSGCRFSASPESHSVTSAGGSGSVAVTTTAACDWTATSNASWLTLSGGGTRSGSGVVQFSVSSTTGPARTGTLTIAGRTVAVTQGSGCTFSISPAGQTVPDGGGPGSIAVSTSAGCPWTASASGSWVQITSGHSGAGAGGVGFTVERNPSSLPRSTTLTVAGQTFTLNQLGAPCSYIVSPAFVQVPSGGASGVFEVNTPYECPWNAASNDGWIHVTAGASGSGDGTVSFAVDGNPGPARVGSITAGGRTFSVSQAAGIATVPR